MPPSESNIAPDAARWSAPAVLGRTPRRAVATVAGVGLVVGLLSSFAATTFTPDTAPTGWVTRVAVTNNDLRSTSESIFRADYRAGLWTGTITANGINASGTVQSTSPWTSKDTATALAAVSWDTGRRIVTRNTLGTAVPFRWASLDLVQQTALGLTTGSKLVDYVRGDRSNEYPSGTKLRQRFSVQGDTLHSTLVYWKHSTGEKRLYVGANDGMLHAFDATNGSEVFAYVPSMVLSRLPKLAVDPYVHTLFVDGGLKVADVKIGSTTKTLLAGALGGGGKGLFMLDVSSPTPATEAAAAALIKWEITSSSTGFGNLGYTYASPRIARLNDGSAAVVVGNGYLNGGNGHATLFIINADTGALIKEIDTGSGSAGAPNGLSTATLVDTNGDGAADYAYAGDIDGNLWRFDLTSASSASWSVSKVITLSPAQAITVAPAITNHPSGGRLVLFGTGRILNGTDADDNADHFAYGVWDGAPAANTTWLNQTVTEVSSGGARLRTVSSNAPNWASGGHMGWRLTLTSGARMVGEEPYVSDERYNFMTTDPTVAATSSIGAEGENWLMEVNYLTGGGLSAPIFDTNGDGTINTSDNISGAVVSGKYLGQGVASQPVLADQTKNSQTLFNLQSDVDYSTPTSSGDPGVSGGHFDVDNYDFAGSSTQFKHVKHTHQYDDKYDVTGVNFLNASDSGFNLSGSLAATDRFKVLVMNQYLSPASLLSIGGGGFVNIKSYGTLATTSDAATALASLPTYTLATIGTLTWKVPLDAFKSKDWWGDGGTARAGVMPTQTGCVNSVSNAGVSSPLGPNGERHNGAMTIQLIKDTTPASALELNHSGGDVKYGWRVKASLFTTYVLAEYTTFWHHPNGKCYNDAGWVPNPPQSTGGTSKSTAKAVGSADPNDGTFMVTPAGVTVSSTSLVTSGNTTTITVTYSDGKKLTTVVTNNNDGTETVTITDRSGTVTSGTRMSTGSTFQAPDETLQVSRRINWREVVRP